MGRKRYRVHWGRLSVFLLFVAAIITGIYFAVAGIISLFRDDSSGEKAEGEATTELLNVSDKSVRETEKMAERIDSLMHIPLRLDTTKIAISIYDLTTQRHVYGMHEYQRLPPASCMKIATAITAMKKLGMDYRYKESLLVRGKMKQDTLRGNLMLLADDDPLCESFDELVKKLRASGVRCIRGNIYLNIAREDTLRPHPTAKLWDIPYHKTPMLMKGKRYVERNLIATLRMNGITYKKDPTVKPKGKYRYVATTTHSLKDVVTPMMIHSSNIKAEAVLYHLDYKTGVIRNKRSDWTVCHATERYLRDVFDKDTTNQTMKGFVFNDGSGLSPENRMTANFLVEILKYAYADKKLRDYFINEAMATPEGMRRGSLLTRMAQPQYRGRIFCKTGTVVTIGASSLSGYLHGRDDHWYVFSIINTDSPVAESRIFQDRLCKMMMSSKKSW